MGVLSFMETPLGNLFDCFLMCFSFLVYVRAPGEARF